MQRLIESLHLLAADEADQRTALPPFVVVADELALIFDAELRGTDLEELPAAIQAQVKQLDETLDDMSITPELWADESLARAEWAKVRDDARALLVALAEEPRRPNLFWLTFVG
jgi:hypothetical protein